MQIIQAIYIIGLHRLNYYLAGGRSFPFFPPPSLLTNLVLSFARVRKKLYKQSIPVAEVVIAKKYQLKLYVVTMQR